MKIFKVWDIRVWDGGDRHDQKYYVSSEAVADMWMKKNPHDYVRAMDLLIFDSLEDIDEFNKNEIRKRALLKLTTEERKALGCE